MKARRALGWLVVAVLASWCAACDPDDGGGGGGDVATTDVALDAAGDAVDDVASDSVQDIAEDALADAGSDTATGDTVAGDTDAGEVSSSDASDAIEPPDGDVTDDDVADDDVADDDVADDDVADDDVAGDDAEDAGGADVTPDAQDDDAIDAGGAPDAGVAEGQCTAESPCDDNFELCFAPGDPFCGMCQQPDPGLECSTNDDCEGGQACNFVDTGCICSPQFLCGPMCMPGGCDEGEQCTRAGNCIASFCGQASDCPPNFACNDGQCARATCAASADCDGYCVKGQCHTTPGFCSPPPP